MSKIYEALRHHEEEAKPPSIASPWPVADVAGNTPADRDMQTLYASLEAAGNKDGGAMIMFASAQPGEGKTTVCGRFAVALSQDFGRSVLILDGDHDHHLSRKLGSNGSSISSVLKLNGGRASRSGSILVAPIASLFGSAKFDGKEIDQVASGKQTLCSNFDYILIDAPSIASVAWTTSIARIADGVILVIEAEKTRWPVAMNTKQEYENSGANVLGAFLNKRRFYIPEKIYRYL
jgi:Mrp family chromosome partitioning ATPase